MSRRSKTQRRAHRSTPSITALRIAVALFFILFSVAMTVVARNERSGWISMTQPGGGDHPSNSLLGYSFLHGPDPFMKENIPHVTQVGVFSGALDAVTLCEFVQNFRFIRGLHSFLASLLTPPLDAVTALLVVNWLSWAVCVWSAWRLTRDAFRSEWAAALAAVLATGGMGMIVHIGDYSPHLLAFATYYLGVWLIFRSGVWRGRRPWPTHLRLGVYMAVACLAYNTGVMLVAVYLATAVRRNRLLPMIAAAAVALTARPLWQRVLGSHVTDVEADYLVRSLDRWWELLVIDTQHLPGNLARWLSEFLFFFDSPLVVVLGLLCCLFTPMSRPKRWFGLVVVAAPIGAGVVFAPSAWARGYLVYCISIWIYACLAYQAVRFFSTPRRAVRFAAAAVLILTLTMHLAWSGAHVARNLGPVKTFFLGWDDGWVYFLPSRAMSLTGQEPTPVLFGGTASLAEAGAYIAPEQHRLTGEQVAFAVAYLAGGFYFIYLGLLLLAAASTSRQGVVWLTGWTLAYCLSCWWAAQEFRTLPAFFPVDRAVTLRPGERLRTEVSLSEDFAQALASTGKDGDVVALFFASERPESLQVRVFAGDAPLDTAPPKDHVYALELSDDRSTTGEAAADWRRLVVEAKNHGDEPVFISGWQRAGLPLRESVRLGEDGAVRARPPVLPAVELRVIDPSGRMKLVGF